MLFRNLHFFCCSTVNRNCTITEWCKDSLTILSWALKINVAFINDAENRSLFLWASEYTGESLREFFFLAVDPLWKHWMEEKNLLNLCFN